MSTAPDVDVPDDIDFQKRFSEHYETSMLMDCCMMDDNTAEKTLNQYERYARFIAVNIRTIGIPKDSGRLMPSNLARKVCFPINMNRNISGMDVLNAIKRMSNGEVYIETATSPNSMFFPRDTVQKMERMKARESGPIMRKDILLLNDFGGNSEN